MRILGVDPGLNITGFGILDVVGDRCLHIHHGVVRTRPSDSLAVRLVVIRDAVKAVAGEFEVTAGAVEAGFVGTNTKSAMSLGQARAAAILGLADAGLEVREYAPALVKSTVAGYGRGEKAQVAQMVKLQLKLPSLPTPPMRWRWRSRTGRTAAWTRASRSRAGESGGSSALSGRPLPTAGLSTVGERTAGCYQGSLPDSVSQRRPRLPCPPVTGRAQR